MRIMMIFLAVLFLPGASTLKALNFGRVSTGNFLPNNSVDGFWHIYHNWNYDGITYNILFKCPIEVYYHYYAKDRSNDYSAYFVEDDNYGFVSELAKFFLWIADEDKAKAAYMAIDFVQNLGYCSETGDYPKYPIQTFSFGGDCEDSSILLAAILRQLNFDVILLNPPGHMAIGLYCSNCNGTYIEKDDRKYYYIETTSVRAIGNMPSEYEDDNFKTYYTPSSFKGTEGSIRYMKCENGVCNVSYSYE